PPEDRSNALVDEHRHPARSGHDLVIVAGGLADHVNDRDAPLVGHQQAANAEVDLVPDAATVQTVGGRDIDRNRSGASPPALADRREPGPAGPGKPTTLAAAIAPAGEEE